MPGRAVWDLRPNRRIFRSVRSLRRSCRHAAPQPAPPPPQQPPPQPWQPPTPPVPRPSAPFPAQPNPLANPKSRDAEMVHAIWYAIGLDPSVRERVMQLLERARKELGYAPTT